MSILQRDKAVLTVTVNPAIDKTYWLDELQTGVVNRVSAVTQLPGGKGNNVLRVLKELGVEAIGTGYLAGANGRWIAEQLTLSGIDHDFYWIPGETRTTVNIIEHKCGINTELLEPGPVVEPGDIRGFLVHAGRLLEQVGHVTISGSLAPGLPVDFYASLVELASAAGVKTYVDTSAEALRKVLQARPYVVKINQTEFEQWLGVSLANQAEIRDGLQRLRNEGCTIAVVTLGAKGCYACSDTGTWYVSSVPVDLVNAVGSGDAFLAGMVSGFVTGLPLSDALTLAIAAGASNAAHPSAGQVDTTQIAQLRHNVVVTELR